MSAPSIIHLSRVLTLEPTVNGVPGVNVRHFAGDQDIEAWLQLRDRSFVTEKPAVRSWTRMDFTAEFLDKPWWSVERMWFAEAGTPIGSLTLAFRGRKPAAMPAIHWLMVIPEWRRRGIGRLLMTTLEAACWHAGYRHVSLETHTGWSAATAFYHEMGYV